MNTININIQVPTLGGYSVEDLTKEIKEYALKLVQKGKRKTSKKSDNIVLCDDLKKLIEMTKQTHISEEDLASDDRLKYLVEK